MNWQKGLRRIRIVFSVLGFLAGLILFGIVSFKLWAISDIVEILGHTKVDLYHLEHAEIISVPDTNQTMFRYERAPTLPSLILDAEKYEIFDAESYKQQLKELRNSVNGITRELHSAWKGWFVTTIVGGFVSLLVVWFMLRVISWIILGFVES
jgi:hypothetical protein